MPAKKGFTKVLVVNESTHQRVRIFAAEQNLTLQEAADELLNEILNKKEVYP